MGVHGVQVLRDPQISKSNAFNHEERAALGLEGLLPSGVDSEETQVQRVMEQLAVKPTDLENVWSARPLCAPDDPRGRRALGVLLGFCGGCTAGAVVVLLLGDRSWGPPVALASLALGLAPAPGQRRPSE